MRASRWVGLAGTALAGLALAPAAQAATRDVTAGPPVERPPAGVPRDAEVNDFFPERTTIAQGDRVRFHIRGFHNVVFPAGGQTPPPFLAPDPANPVAGQSDAAGRPFWFNGLPRIVADPRSAFPVGGTTVDGSTLVSSGLPQEEGEPRPFTVRFPNRGVYRYLCTVHPGMDGVVRVRARGAQIPSAARHRRAAARQFAAAVIRARRLGRFEGPRGARIQAGSDQGNVVVLRFVPRRKTVRVGRPVTLAMARQTTEAHTFTFGPPAYLRTIVEGLIAPAPNPAGPPTLVFNPLAAYASDPPPAFPPITPTLHGNGFFNTGVLDRERGSPNPGAVRVTFGQPGRYRYICLIHPQMRGEVRVTA